MMNKLITVLVLFVVPDSLSIAIASDKCPKENQAPAISQGTEAALQECKKEIERGVDTKTRLAPFCFGDLKSGANPEKQMSELMSDVSEEEAFTRLIFAETLAANCPTTPPESISEGIAWVLANRKAASNETRFGKGRHIVFKDRQFRSTTGSCDVAKRKEFLCPQMAGKDWEKRWKIAQEAYRKTQKGNSKRASESGKPDTNENANPLGSKTFQYFFGHHFDQSKDCAQWKGVKPNWANKELEVQPQISGYDPASECVRYYK